MVKAKHPHPSRIRMCTATPVAHTHTLILLKKQVSKGRKCYYHRYSLRMGNGMRQEWEIYICYIEYITATLLLKCINKNKQNKSYFIRHQKKTVQSKVIFVWEVKQKARNHHTDEIEAHRYQVANELKERTHIHT